MAAGVLRSAWSDRVRRRCLRRRTTYYQVWAMITIAAVLQRERLGYRRVGSDASQAHRPCPTTTSPLTCRPGTTNTNPLFGNVPPFSKRSGPRGGRRKGGSQWALSPGTGMLSSLGKTRHSMSRVRSSRGRDRTARVTARARSTPASAASRSPVSLPWT